MGGRWLRKILPGVLLILPLSLAAQSPGDAEFDEEVAEAEAAEAPSPWLLVPRISSDPKIGTSLGFLAGYLFGIDEDSTSSLVGVTASYSDTDSVLGGLFSRAFWDNDSKRLIGFLGGGQINNDYEDFQGSGLPLSTTDEAKVFYLKYLHEVYEHWYLGLQGVYTNYVIVPGDHRIEQVMELKGLTGVDSGALGLVAMFDSRDRQNAPSSGIRFAVDNFAYREVLGGEQDFDVCNVDFRHYLPHGEGHVFASHASGRWTWDAPAAGYSSVSLRGYTLGQYLAPYSTTLEIEERLRLRKRLGLNLFTGVACLYGDDRSCGNSEDIFVSAGLGLQYVIKPSENMVVTADYAVGEDDSRGFYLRFGQAF